jgi:peptidoglycan/LPS O-acetylase OafA/YrhL
MNIPQNDEPPTRRLRLPSLDGWRAVAIVMVLGGHSTFTVGFPEQLRPLFGWIFDANLGVRFFFVLSGFLITWLLMVEEDSHGRINFSHFYLRRALRILPVYGAFLLVLFALEFLTPYRQGRDVWICNLTFTRNFIDGGWTSNHLWSLSVEEQFYLLWPGLFALSGCARNVRLACWCIAIPLVIAPLSRFTCSTIDYFGSYYHTQLYPAYLSPLFLASSTFNYCDALALGCGSAILFVRGQKIVQICFVTYARAAMSVALLFILIPYISERFPVWNMLVHSFDPILQALGFSMKRFSDRLFFVGLGLAPWGPTLQALGFSMLLLKSIISPGGFFRILNWGWVRWIGVLSYSLYIWQMIFCTDPKIFGLGPVWWMGFPGWLVPVFIVATLSYYGLERPLFRLRSALRDVPSLPRRSES